MPKNYLMLVYLSGAFYFSIPTGTPRPVHEKFGPNAGNNNNMRKCRAHEQLGRLQYSKDD